MKYDFDLFTIGGGSGGVRASRVSAGYGAKVAIAESDRFGGTCVNVGCIPKKLFSYAAHMREDFEVAASFGWTLGEPRFDGLAQGAGGHRARHGPQPENPRTAALDEHQVVGLVEAVRKRDEAGKLRPHRALVRRYELTAL